jgi:hypothetical protein
VTDDLAERQALTRLAEQGYTEHTARAIVALLDDSPRCTWGDDAWHRAVQRLLTDAKIRSMFRRLLAQERAKTGGGQP